MSSSSLGGGRPWTAFHLSKTGKGEIEGTIMRLSSWERIYTQNKTYSKLWFLLYIYSVTPHLRQGGREEGGRRHPSQFRGLAGREKHEEKQTWNQEKKKQSEQPSLPPLFYCSTLFLVSFVSPLIWWKSRIWAFLLFLIYKWGKI